MGPPGKGVGGKIQPLGQILTSIPPSLVAPVQALGSCTANFSGAALSTSIRALSTTGGGRGIPATAGSGYGTGMLACLFQPKVWIAL